MAISEQDIEELVAACDAGRARWIAGQAEWTDGDAPYRQADDMTIFPPQGGTGPPPGITPEARDALQAHISAQFHGGEGSCELVRVIVEGDVVVLVLVERSMVTFEGHAERQPWVLRSTQVFRRDGNRWLRLHRHADPLIDVRSLEAAVTLAKGG